MNDAKYLSVTEGLHPKLLVCKHIEPARSLVAVFDTTIHETEPPPEKSSAPCVWKAAATAALRVAIQREQLVRVQAVDRREGVHCHDDDARACVDAGRQLARVREADRAVVLLDAVLQEERDLDVPARRKGETRPCPRTRRRAPEATAGFQAAEAALQGARG